MPRIEPLSDVMKTNKIPVSRNTVYRWVNEGAYSNIFFKLFGRIVVDLDEFEKEVKASKKRLHKKKCTCNCVGVKEWSKK